MAAPGNLLKNKITILETQTVQLSLPKDYNNECFTFSSLKLLRLFNIIRKCVQITVWQCFVIKCCETNKKTCLCTSFKAFIISFQSNKGNGDQTLLVNRPTENRSPCLDSLLGVFPIVNLDFWLMLLSKPDD